MRNSKNNLSKVLKGALLITLSIVIIGLIIWLSLFFKKKEVKSEISMEIPQIKISILNGCGIDGAASTAKNYLINNYNNIDIISWGNVERGLYIYGKSIIIVKKKNEEKLLYLMQVTGISRRIYAVDEDTIEDMQIILGDDYRNYFKE